MLKEIIEKLKRPFKAEVKSGFLNTSVFGGFDKYILSHLDQLQIKVQTGAEIIDPTDVLKAVDDLKQLFRTYRTIGPDERQECIRQAIPLIQLLDKEAAGMGSIEESNDDNNANKSGDNLSQVESSENQDIPEKKSLDQQLLDNLRVLDKSVQYIKGIGPKRAKIMERLNVTNVMDMLYYLPREYSDRSEVLPIAEVKNIEGEVTIEGQVVSIQENSPRRGMKIVKVGIHDDSGLAFGVWFNQPYIKNQFKNGDKVIFSGKMNQKNYNRYRKIELNNPIYENLESDEYVHTRRIVPIYPLTEGLSQKVVREMTKNALDEYLYQMPELIPEVFRRKFGLLGIDATLRAIHFPENRALLDEAKRRLIFEDFFLLQLGILVKRNTVRFEASGYLCRDDREILQAFLNFLPYKLTEAQSRVWHEISQDMEKKKPMYRLLQGDVGSGKTVVAAMTLIKGIENGLQGALMAPTEILAEQHYLSIKNWFETLDLRVELLTGSMKKKSREEKLLALQSGEIHLVIGTHALIQEEVQFDKLGVVVIDEQHRFGVEQRELLRKKGLHPHVLVMTATPIPRSMALTIYGDLDLSVIDQLPPGRKPIITAWRGSETRDKIYSFVKEQLDQGKQAYVVCPLIEESEVIDVESATQMAEYLTEEVFYEYQVALLTGQTPRDERDQLMRNFRDGKIDILVATTVIEVGVDVPNASIMIIEDAQRFGLAQLHQLRGRVGRGQAQSYCILIGDATTPEGERRLEVMVETNDGFKIAEEDLAIRGPGEFFGTRQHGLPEFKIANLIRDWEVLEVVREEVQEMLKQTPELIGSQLLQKILRMRFKGSFFAEE